MSADTVPHPLDRVIKDLTAVAAECEAAKTGANSLPMDAYPPALNRISTNLRKALTAMGEDGEDDAEDDAEAGEDAPKRRRGRK